MRRAAPVAGLVLLAVGLAWTAREPASGTAWRVAFVAIALDGVPLVAWAIRALRPTTWVLLGVAIVLRLVLLPLPPTLSDDGYRYLWDGALTLEGQSPYGSTPREATEAGFVGPVPFEALNSPDYHTVYPPVSQALFALAMALGGSFGMAWLVLKLLITAVELGGVWALARHVRPEALAWYAWHPVAVVEVAGQGHTEGLAIGCLSFALASVLAKREGRGGAFLALAGWTKLWPFALAFLERGSRFWFGLAAVAVVVGLPWVIGMDGPGVLGSLALYGGTFDFYSAPFSLVKSLLWPVVGEGAGRGASLALAAGSVSLLSVIAINKLDLVRSWVLATLAIVLLSSTLHPWHLLPALWAAVVLGTRWSHSVVWLVSVAPLTYLVYVGLPWVNSVALAVGWGGAAVIGIYGGFGDRLLDRVLRIRGRRKWDRISAFLGPTGSLRLLDLGCAEGYVGAAAADEGHDVTLADVHDVRRVEMPFVRVGERNVPLADGSADLVALVFVLHHADDPSAVLHEASRVAGQMVVWETVPAPWMPKPLLQLIDTFVNQTRGPREMRRARLRTSQEWERLYSSLGLSVLQRARWGIGHPQTLWLLERREDL